MWLTEKKISEKKKHDKKMLSSSNSKVVKLEGVEWVYFVMFILYFVRNIFFGKHLI